MNAFTIVVLLIFVMLVGVTFYLNHRKKRNRHFGSSFDFSKMPNKSLTGKREKN